MYLSDLTVSYSYNPSHTIEVPENETEVLLSADKQALNIYNYNQYEYWIYTFDGLLRNNGAGIGWTHIPVKSIPANTCILRIQQNGTTETKKISLK